jgi:hypothetical protein
MLHLLKLLLGCPNSYDDWVWVSCHAIYIRVVYQRRIFAEY